MADTQKQTTGNQGQSQSEAPKQAEAQDEAAQEDQAQPSAPQEPSQGGTRAPEPAEVAPARPAMAEYPLEEIQAAVPAHQPKAQELLVQGPIGQAPTPEQVGNPAGSDDQRSDQRKG